MMRDRSDRPGLPPTMRAARTSAAIRRQASARASLGGRRSGRTLVSYRPSVTWRVRGLGIPTARGTYTRSTALSRRLPPGRSWPLGRSYHELSGSSAALDPPVAGMARCLPVPGWPLISPIARADHGVPSVVTPVDAFQQTSASVTGSHRRHRSVADFACAVSVSPRVSCGHLELQAATTRVGRPSR